MNPDFPESCRRGPAGRAWMGPGWARLLLALGLAAWAPLASAAEAARRAFSIPAGDATRALETFADQTRAQVLFGLDQVRGVQTNRVEGTFTDREALDRLLGGTPLRASEDPGTGVFSVLREPPPGPVVDRVAPGPAAPKAAAPVRSRFRDTLRSVLAVDPPPVVQRADATVPAGGDVTRLHPFEIAEARDNSFRAMAVGSGSRLQLLLRDTPVPYSIINRELIEALGITDLAEAAAWATGQTFFTSDNGGDNVGRPSQYFSRGNLTAQGGPDSFGAQRNFYQNPNNGGDSYAVESYEFGRGPNAALFGQGNGPTSAGDASNGGLAGVSSLQTKRAQFDGARGVVRVELGSWEFRRATLDINQPLGERVAVRLNAVDFDRAGWRQFDMEATRGLTLAATWRAAPGVELSMEGSTDRRRSRNTGSGQDERISGWDGRTVFRGPITNAMLSADAVPGANRVANASYGTLEVLGLGNGVPGNDPLGLTFNGETSGVARLAGPRYLYDPYRGTVMNYQNLGVTRRADDTSRVPLWSRTAPNGAFFVRGTTDIDGIVGDRFGRTVSFGVGRSFWAKEGIPADAFRRAEASSRFRFPSQRWVPTLDKPATEQRARDANLALSVSRGNLTVELGGDMNTTFNETRNWDNPGGALGGGRSTTIDVNQLRPDGTPNPGFLDVINTFALAQSTLRTGDATVRVNAGYVIGESRLGAYVFNLQASRATHDTDSRTMVLSTKLNADSRRWQNEPVAIVLWGSDRVRAYREPVGAAGARFTNVDWTNPNAPAIEAPRTIFPGWIVSNASATSTVTDYVLAQTTARWFGGRLVFNGAVRHDRAQGRTWNAIAQGDRPVGWRGELLWRPDAPADYFSMTYVPRNATTGQPLNGRPLLSGNRPRTSDPISGLNIADPLYAADRFRDDFNSPQRDSRGTTKSLGLSWRATRFLSPHFNYSDSYTPQNAASLDLGGETRALTQAHGYDAGALLSFRNEAITLKYNFYRQVRENDAFTPATAAAINTLYAANAAADPETGDGGRNIRGAAPLPGADYRDRVNSGFELELSVQDFLPGLRVAANGSSGWFYNTNRGRKILAYVPANAALFRQVLEDAGGMLDLTQRPADAPGAPGLAIANPAVNPAFPGDRDAAVAAYNNIWINHAQMLRERPVRVRTQPQINAVVDYTLQRGPLRGLGLSAGIQWQGRFVLFTQGNNTILDPNLAIPTAIDNPAVDENSFQFLKGRYNTQANLRYTFRLKRNQTLGVALRINNILNDRSISLSDASVGGQGFGFEGVTALRQPEGDLTKPNRVTVGSQPSRFSEPMNFRLAVQWGFGGSTSDGD